ncbi:hypothetical protein PCE1_001798 [Barthelona sp. PCE]
MSFQKNTCTYFWLCVVALLILFVIPPEKDVFNISVPPQQTVEYSPSDFGGKWSTEVYQELELKSNYWLFSNTNIQYTYVTDFESTPNNKRVHIHQSSTTALESVVFNTVLQTYDSYKFTWAGPNTYTMMTFWGDELYKDYKKYAEETSYASQISELGSGTLSHTSYEYKKVTFVALRSTDFYGEIPNMDIYINGSSYNWEQYNVLFDKNSTIWGSEKFNVEQDGYLMITNHNPSSSRDIVILASKVDSWALSSAKYSLGVLTVILFFLSLRQCRTPGKRESIAIAQVPTMYVTTDSRPLLARPHVVQPVIQPVIQSRPQAQQTYATYQVVGSLPPNTLTTPTTPTVSPHATAPIYDPSRM